MNFFDTIFFFPVLFCVILVAYSFFTNLYRMCILRSSMIKYELYINTGSDLKEILLHKRQVLDLFRKAGIADTVVPHSESVDSELSAVVSVSVMDNYGIRNQRFSAIIMGWFLEAIGTYRLRMLDSLNPLKWIETVLFLPASVIRYLGLSSDNIFTKILQLLWWLLAPLAVIFRNRILEIIRVLFQ